MRKRIIMSLFGLGMLASLATARGRAQDKMPDEKTAKDEMAGDKMSGDKMAQDKMEKKKSKKKSKAKTNKMDKMNKKEDGRM